MARMAIFHTLEALRDRPILPTGPQAKAEKPLCEAIKEKFTPYFFWGGTINYAIIYIHLVSFNIISHVSIPDYTQKRNQL